MTVYLRLYTELVDLIEGANCFKERGAPLFVPVTWLAYIQNNHTETGFIKALLGQLALTSYWLTLTS